MRTSRSVAAPHHFRLPAGVALLLLAAIAIGIGPSAVAEGAGNPDRLKIELAKELADLAKWCQRKDLDLHAKAYAEEALEMAPDCEPAKDILERIDGDAENTTRDSILRSYERRLDRDGKKIARLYMELFLATNADANKAPDVAYLKRAHHFHAEETEEFLDEHTEDLLANGSGVKHAHALLKLAQELAPNDERAEQLKRVEYRLAETTPIVRKASSHQMHYYLTLPKGWDPEADPGTYPVIVCVEGAGCGFAGCHRIYARERGEHPFLVVTPIGFSNTNSLDNKGPKYPWYEQSLLEEVEANGQAKRIDWDEAGLLAVLADLREEFHARRKIFITGFSGGGMLTWTMVLRHPDMVAAAAPSCGNFTPSIDNGRLPTPPDPALPVVAFQGKSDNYLESILNPQWANCEACYQKMGYTNVERRMVEGGHGNFGKLIVPFFVEHLDRSKGADADADGND